MNGETREQLKKLITSGEEIGLAVGYDVCNRKEIEDFIDQAIQADHERLVGEIEKQKEIQYENETKRQWYEKEGKNKMADIIVNLINNK